MSTGDRTIGARFAAGPNALNLVRLCLAVEVVLWHSYALRGDTWLPGRVEAFLGDIAVDSFFAISGFLICRAWLRRPELGPYLLARARRILPGLWVCLVVTAFVVAPVTAWVAGVAPPSLRGQWGYVVANADTWVGSAWGIDGGPVGVPVAGAWNGSLWSLGYEASCYVAVAVLGFTRLLRPSVVVAAALTSWVLSAALVVAGVTADGMPIWLGPRCTLMFACGALLWMWADRVPVSRLLAAIAAGALVGSLVLPNYRLLAAPAIAYLCLVIGIRLGRHPRLVMRFDLSYGLYIYAFVLQQAMLMAGVELSWLPFALVTLVLTLPVAALSWFVVEEPLQRRRRRVAASRQPAGRGTMAPCPSRTT